MSTLRIAATAASLALGLSVGVFAAESQNDLRPNLGQPITPGDLAPWDISVMPDGTGLPPGSGTAVQGAPISFDISANFLFYEKFWLGAMYRHDDAAGALVQYQITDDISVGYSYDYPLSILADYSGGSHEIMLGFEFGNKMKGIRSPRYF